MRHDQALKRDGLPGMACKGELWWIQHQSVGRILCDVYRCDGCRKTIRFRSGATPSDETFVTKGH